MYPIGSIIQRTLEEKVPYSIYNHVGIYIGVHFNEQTKANEHQVIHFSQKDWSEKKRKAKIIKTSLDEFKRIRGKSVKVILREEPEDEEHGRAICEKAEEIYRNLHNKYNNEYSPFFNNCEDFAIHCYEVKYKKKTKIYPRIPQADKTSIGIGLVGLVVGILGLLKGGDDKGN
ncbi:hypothetical protein BGP_2001 [Beggiatoa sp. PS]|nr:hypothetical protein BGP_2001 [Beggiatoa sp. PS]